MKKLLAITLALLLALGITACGKTASNDEADESSTKTSQSEPAKSNDDSKKDDDSDTSSKDGDSSSDPKGTESDSKTESSKPVTTVKPNTTLKPKPTEPSDPIVDLEPETTPNTFFNPNNSNYDANAVSIKPRYVYWENGSLVAECFVINGFAHNVFNINVKSITFSNSSGVIASGSGFGVLNNVNLPPYTNIIWTFKFAPDTVSKYGADLSKLICNASVSNSY